MFVNGEVVKPIREGSIYYVSESGRVYNSNNNFYELAVRLIELPSGLIYKVVKIFENGQSVSRCVHRLVHYAFNGSSSRPHHKDGNCFNNHYTNLTDKKREHILEKREKWLEGYEGRYFIKGRNVYSVLGEYPKKLKSTSYDGKDKYQLYDSNGVMKSFYI